MDAAPDSMVCSHCGGGLNSLGFEQNKYRLVPDGELYGIALRDRTVLHKMELAAARDTLALFNEKKKVG
jgi:hypothetical protein